MNVRYFVSLATGLLFASLSQAGSVIQFETRELNTETPLAGTITFSTEGLMTRLDINSTAEGGSATMIFHGDQNELLMRDHVNKRYFLLTQQQTDELAGHISDAMKQMEAALADLPPDQRAMAEQMMKDSRPAMNEPVSSISVSESGGSDNVAGYDCDNYVVTDAGIKILDMCVAAWDEIEGGQESAEALEKFSDYLSTMKDSFPGTGGGGEQDMFAHMKTLGGYPVKSTNYDAAGQAIAESRIISAATEDLDPTVFEPPADYTQQQMF